MEGQKSGERHQGLRRIKPSLDVAREHLAKAIHNFEAMTTFYDLHYSDWSASAAFYALYLACWPFLPSAVTNHEINPAHLPSLGILLSRAPSQLSHWQTSRKYPTGMLLQISPTATKYLISGNGCNILQKPRLRKKNFKSSKKEQKSYLTKSVSKLNARANNDLKKTGGSSLTIPFSSFPSSARL